MGTAPSLLELAAGDYALTLAPEVGGSIRSFSWRGEPLLRNAAGASILDAACFPLVPYSNRINHGRFRWQGRAIDLPPNFPGSDHPHPLHGFGWNSPWTVQRYDAFSAELECHYLGSAWPWPCLARQSISLTARGLDISLSLTNLGDSPMPAGLGFHPYFPRNDQTLLRARHKGEWQNDADGLPIQLNACAEACDWWQGRPVSQRVVDTVYSERSGEIAIGWPDRAIWLQMQCEALLRHTAIFVPADENWFCVEPVSHPTDAFNRGGTGLVLQPEESVATGITLAAFAWPAADQEAGTFGPR